MKNLDGIILKTIDKIYKTTEKSNMHIVGCEKAMEVGFVDCEMKIMCI